MKTTSPSKKEENKKIKNTQKTTVDGINFKSRLEAYCYEELKKIGIKPLYESERQTLFEGFKPEGQLKLYTSTYKNKKIIGYEINKRKIQDITYTVDFAFEYKDHEIKIEVKGYPTDSYAIKKKMYLKILHEKSQKKPIIFFEPRNMGQVRQTIETLLSL